MALVSRFTTRALVVGGLLLASPLIVMWAAAPSDSSCEALSKWARPYAHASMTLDRLTGFDLPHRRAIFTAVSPEVRADLWREQLRRFGDRSDLSEAQRAFVRDTLTSLTPTLYEQPAAQRHEAAQRLRTQIARLFTSKDHRRAWIEIGALGSVEPQSAPSLLSRLTGSFFASAHLPQCDCSSDDECPSANCTHNACTLQDACGPAGLDTCWGLCS